LTAPQIDADADVAGMSVSLCVDTANFIAGRYLFYYSAATAEIRPTAIIPAAMRLA
jgi:hypothetical protein